MAAPTSRRYSPEQIQQYIVATQFEGMTKKDAFKEFINKDASDSGINVSIANLEKTERYLDLLSVVDSSSMSKAKQAMEVSMAKYYEKYGTLLDEGQRAIEQATNIEEKQAMMKEQRANLAMPVILNAQQSNREVKELDTGGIIM